MSKLSAGFGRVNINPTMGIEVGGYYKIRIAEAILDDLEINALALTCNEKRVILISIDHLGIGKKLMDNIRMAISKATGVPFDAIMIAATHTHTGPHMRCDATDSMELTYIDFVTSRAVDAAIFALEDLKPSTMGWGIGQAPRVSFVRRFRMKDGSIKTNPGVDNPDIVAPIGDVDERVNVLRFDREGGDTLVLVNFGNHPDVVGGCKISADWPGFLRRTVEKTIDNTKCIFFNGAQGDVNHVNVHPEGGDLNGMFMDFDDVSRGYAHARHIGNVVAGGVLQVYEKVKYVDVDDIRYVERSIEVPSNRATAEELVEAKRINDLHNAGKDSELPYKGMMLTTVVAEAARMVRLENGPDSFGMTLYGLSIGPVALSGIPGEPFTGIGRGIKETKGYDVILPIGLANGCEGYFPMQEAYDEGGYESRSSQFKAGVAEYIISESQTMLTELGGKK